MSVCARAMANAQLHSNAERVAGVHALHEPLATADCVHRVFNGDRCEDVCEGGSRVGEMLRGAVSQCYR